MLENMFSLFSIAPEYANSGRESVQRTKPERFSCFSDVCRSFLCQLYCSIWHVDGLSKPIYLEDVKSGGIAISPTKEWVAVCSRRELRDTISVYAVNASEPIKTPNLPQKITQLTLLSRWCVPRLSRRFPCGDIRQIRWCIEREDSDISDAYIALVDTALFDAVYVYRAVDGSLVRCISNDPSIQSLSENSTQDALDETQSASSSRAEREIGVLGVSSIDFRSRKLAVADHTHSIRIYGESNAYMRPLAALAHPQTVFGPTKVGPDEILLFREYSTRLEGDDVHACMFLIIKFAFSLRFSDVLVQSKPEV